MTRQMRLKDTGAGNNARMSLQKRGQCGNVR